MNANPAELTHLCETCKKCTGCDTGIEIDNGYFDEVLMDRVNDADRQTLNPTLTTVVVECNHYEKQ